MSKYHQLTHEQRYTIYRLKQQGFSQHMIAKIISVSDSTVSRELKRNTGRRGYRPRQAHNKCLERRHTARKRILFNKAMKEYVCKALSQYYSPEQIVGRAKRQGVCIVSVERIYQFIWADKKQSGSLYKYLRTSQKKKRKRYGSYDRRGQIQNRRFIDERPDLVELKERIGDYEIDTIVGKGRTRYLVTIVERKSKYSFIGLTESKKAEQVSRQTVKLLKPVMKKVHTITGDNGKEFALHDRIAHSLETDFYFAHPYRSWERGLSENTNGLIRQFFPKGHDFKHIRQTDIDNVMEMLNNRPRKSLDYRTPNEVFWNEIT